MGFMTPNIPRTPPAANPAVSARDAQASVEDVGLAPGAASLISTSSRGLQRRPSTQRTSLIGG